MGLISVGLIFFFASLVTLQLGIAAALLRRRPRWRGFVSLLPPLAPLAIYWALKEKMYVLCGLWGVSVALYALLLTSAYSSAG